ncbi:unnamed protein product [Protopolystoma xenopodis]|uniref:Peptidase M13 C-terminal domain-containing protein n=1 Tax=Protopolystoma xenopodis TaxID=117903 RepID=A0A448XL68_9PLAT|nr:unnamed protein product [Protopolystoma xenopodis]
MSENANAVFLLAGIAAEFETASQPMALHYGFMGFILGHEVFHAFDYGGR